jgi:hypothetical protein
MQVTPAPPSGARRLELKECRRQLACRYLESRQIEEFASTACAPLRRVCCVAHQWHTYTTSMTRGCSMRKRSPADPTAMRRVGFSASPGRSSAPRPGPPERLTLRSLLLSLNLSTSAVSIVLNARAGSERIPIVTRERILAAARNLNYRPNVLAKSLRRRRSSPSGCSCPTVGRGERSHKPLPTRFASLGAMCCWRLITGALTSSPREHV